jgi:tRNA(Ile)-lysidine synthase
VKQQVINFLNQHNLFSRGSRLLLAVSGGPDSTCLLHILFKLRKKLEVELFVAHLDHQLRGAESEADANYVETLAKSLNIPVIVGKKDVKVYRKEQRISLEEAAREVRYQFLTDVADNISASCIVTGHTSDDQVETILMHIIRGTGTRGLISLKPYNHRQLKGSTIPIVRPFLEISRRQTVDYCKENKLIPRLDTSNLSLSPLRNKIRQQLLPLLMDYNPAIKDALLRIATIANDEIVFLDKEVSRMWPMVVTQKEDMIILNKERFTELPTAIQRHLLRTAIEKLLSSLKDIETRHIEEILAVLDKPAGRQINLPRELIFSIEYDKYLLGLTTVNNCPYSVIGDDCSINVPGETEFPGWLVSAEIIKQQGITKEQDMFTAYLDLDIAGNQIKVRHKKVADRFQPLGMTGSKKLSEFMIDAKVPHNWRERIPVVYSPRQILWLVGYRIDNRVKVTKETQRVLKLKFSLC